MRAISAPDYRRLRGSLDIFANLPANCMLYKPLHLTQHLSIQQPYTPSVSTYLYILTSYTVQGNSIYIVLLIQFNSVYIVYPVAFHHILVTVTIIIINGSVAIKEAQHQGRQPRMVCPSCQPPKPKGTERLHPNGACR